MSLYYKLYNIDKFGHKRHLKKLKPIFQFKQNTLGGYKKHEIIRVAQENLFMLKRLNERTSFYNVEKWNKDYEASQQYKKNHCLYSPIDFNKTQRLGGYGKSWGFDAFQEKKNYTTRKKFFSKTHYYGMGIGENPESKRFATSTKKRKRFEDFNYRDLLLDDKNKNEKEQQFKKISEIETPEQEPQNEKEESNENNNEINTENNEKDNNEDKEEQKEEEKREERSEGKNEEKSEEKSEEKKDEENEGQKEQKNNNPDDKEEKGEIKKENEENGDNKIKSNSEEL